MVEFIPQADANYKYDYLDIFKSIAAGRINKIGTYRELCKKDLFFLLCFGLERIDVNRAWLVDRIREVEEKNNDTMDLWAREHYKSTIATFGLPIKELIINPEERIAIFSHTRPIAKGFLRQIKITLEGNPPVKKWFPDVFYAKPKSQAPKWSEDDGLIVKRKTTPKESSVEAWGLVDGQPTSKHFTKRIYDDVVTEDGVGNSEQIKKTLKAYELSQSLGTDGGSKRLVGTHYHFADLYMHYKKKAIYTVRQYPATDDGKATGTPVFISSERLDELRREQSQYVFACQQLLNPLETDDVKFKMDYLKFYTRKPEPVNKYLIVDPANEKKKKSDYTAMGVIGIDVYNNYVLLDLIRAKLNLGERWAALLAMWKKWWPIERVGYEKYGMQSDITYFEEKQQQSGVYFHITPLGGNMAKWDRIDRLIPIFEEGRFLLPHRLIYNGEDMIKSFIDDEYQTAPYCVHEDILDMMSRIKDDDMKASGPIITKHSGAGYKQPATQSDWMAA